MELWQSNGTAAGTVLVDDITPGSFGSSPSNLTDVNGRLFFTASVIAGGIEYGQEVWAATGTNVLPLHLVSFTGSKENSANHIEWKTTNEINTDQFVLERSIDGSSFNSIAIVTATGNSMNSYSYNDPVQVEKAYYRLKMVDNDGSFTYSNIILIASENIQFRVYPNPVRDKVTLQLSSDELINSKARIIDMSGKVLQQLILHNRQQIIDVSQLPAGVYFLQLQGGVWQKLVKE
jgi:ELWxxDGT repeat protein